MHAAPKSGSDLFEQPYVYLISGDEKFAILATNYRYTVPSPDSMFQIETHPVSKNPSDTTAQDPQYFEISVKRPMTLRVIFADSAATGLIVFEFKNVPVGTYTMGDKKWPAPLRDQLSGRKGANVFFATDLRFRGRFTFNTDSNHRVTSARRYEFPKR
jgi:hypothetical protein